MRHYTIVKDIFPDINCMILERSTWNIIRRVLMKSGMFHMEQIEEF